MKATTIGQALKLGAAAGDFEFDLRKGFASCPSLVALPVEAAAVVREDFLKREDTYNKVHVQTNEKVKS